MLTGDILDEEIVRAGVQGADMVFNYAGIADIGEANNRRWTRPGSMCWAT